MVKKNTSTESENITIGMIVKEIADVPALIFRKFRFSIFEDSDLTPPQISVLQILRENSDAMRMSDLAGMIRASFPAVTGIVSRLVDKGLVERGDDPKDRRVVTVALTKNGRKTLEDFYCGVEELWSDLLKDFDQDEMIEILNMFRKLKAILHREDTK